MNDRLKPREQWGLLALLVLHVVVLPLLVMGAGIWWGWHFGGLSDAQINLVYYGIGVALCFVFAGGYLRRSFDSLLDRPLEGLQAYLLAWAIYFALNAVMSLILFSFDFFSEINPNQTAITDIAAKDRGIMIAITVFMTPVVEETIFRGGIFCGLYHKNRVLAYVLSVALFCVYHIWQYAFAASDPRLLLFAIEYIPASFALCRCYEKSGSIWVCIAFHMSVNALALFVM